MRKFIFTLFLLMPISANAENLDAKFCAGSGLCHVHKNGDVQMHVSGPDRCYYIVGPKGRIKKSTCKWGSKK
jgi:hypothetical protein